MQQALTLKKHPEHRLQTLRLFIYLFFFTKFLSFLCKHCFIVNAIYYWKPLLLCSKI